MTDPLKISLWGAPQTGKTTYLAALFATLEGDYDVSFPASTYRPDGGLNDAEEFRKIVRRLDDGILPESTEATPRQYFLHGQKLRLHGLRTTTIDMTLVDVSGELTSENFGRTSAEIDDYQQELYNSDGIILLIDPDRTQDDYHYYSLLDELFVRLTDDTQHYTDKVLAYCITKIDLPPHWQHRKNAEAYLQQILPERAFNKIKQTSHPQRTRFFAVSSIGRYPANDDDGFPNLRHALINTSGLRPEYDVQYRIAKPELWQPYGVVEPFQWMTNQLGRAFV